MYFKDLFESKYQLLIKRRQKTRIEYEKNPQAFIDYSQTVDDVYEHLEEYYPSKKRKVVIVFDDMIVDMEANKKLCHIVTDLFIRGGKFLISLASIS